MNKSLLWFAALPCLAWAGPSLNLDAAAQSQLPNDEMVMVLAVERSGPEVARLNEQVLEAANAALAQAKAEPKLHARLGGVNTQPEWGPNGRVTGWRVRAEVALDSRDFAALAKLGGRLSAQMQIASVGFRLSREAREKEEQRLVKEAAERFGAKAQSWAQAFGYRGYAVKELTVGSAGYMPPPPRPMVMRAEAGMAASVAVPTEGGNSDVVVNVAGKVELEATPARN